MRVYKLFEKDLTCRGYQFKPGLNACEEANCVQNGFHAAENPLDCLAYYRWEDSVCWLCNAGGDIDEDGRDSKISCTELTLEKELSLKEYMVHAASYIIRHPLRFTCERWGAVSVFRLQDCSDCPDCPQAEGLLARCREGDPETILAKRTDPETVTVVMMENEDGSMIREVIVREGTEALFHYSVYD